MKRDTQDFRAELIEFGSLTLAALLGYGLVIVREDILPSRFSNDASHVQEIAMQPIIQEDGAFAAIARVYQFLGLGSNHIAAGLFTYTCFVLAVVVAMRRLQELALDRRGTSVIAGISLVLGAVFTGTYSKDLFTAVIVLCFLVMRRTVIAEAILVILMLAYGTVRPYWFIVAAFYLVLRLAFKWRIERRQLVFLIFALIAGAGMAIYLYTGVSADYFRNVVNQWIHRQSTETLIVPYFSGFEPVSGILNTLATWVLLLFPVPLFTKGSLYHMASGILLLALTVTGIRGTAWFGSSEAVATSILPRVTALLISFSAVQALFEPDYGSYLRHLVSLLPLLLLLTPDFSQLRAYQDRPVDRLSRNITGSAPRPRLP